jgi:hypothetical protein
MSDVLFRVMLELSQLTLAGSPGAGPARALPEGTHGHAALLSDILDVLAGTSLPAPAGQRPPSCVRT